ncbi:MAG: aspartate carbamoyltransferase, partial [Chlorobi bacterium]|nr:aspartate carbamoyltransferase [Chlorobiota bacterium]
VKLYFIAPDKMQIKPDILDHLEENGIAYQLSSSMEDIVNKVDVVYQTRISEERIVGTDIDPSIYYLDTNVLQKMKYNSIIMHPMPKSIEISSAVDSDPRAAYFRQSANGICVRMALLSMIFEND